MRMCNSIVINKPADEIWELLGPNFVRVADWMAATPRSEEKTEGTPLPGAPAVGRRSYLMAKFNGMYQDETITKYDADARLLNFDVVLKKGPAVMPISGYLAEFTVEMIDATTSRVSLDATAHLRLLGYFMYPVVKKGLNAGFIRYLEEIKHYSETGRPHPRKVQSMQEEAAA